MCRAHSGSRYNNDLELQGQIWVFDMFSCPAHNFFWFDIGTYLPYLAHGPITIRWCVTYIHDSNLTLTFDLTVKFLGFSSCLRVRPITIFCLGTGLPYLAYNIWHMGNHHERMCWVHSWFWYDADLWPQANIFNDMFMTWLCVRASAYGSFT